MRRRGMRLTSGILTGALALGLFAVPKISVQAATEHWNDGSAESKEWTDWKDIIPTR